MLNKVKQLFFGILVFAALFSFTAFNATNAAYAAAASGCNSVATGNWSNNCTVYKGNISNFAVAIQTSVNASGTKDAYGHLCSTGGIDGNFGSNTFGGVECFQGAKNIGVDGIVGPQTWGTMYNMLRYTGYSSGGFAFYNMPNSGVNFDFARDTSTNVWWVWFGGNANHWCTMNLSSPC